MKWDGWGHQLCELRDREALGRPLRNNTYDLIAKGSHQEDSQVKEAGRAWQSCLQGHIATGVLIWCHLEGSQHILPCSSAQNEKLKTIFKPSTCDPPLVTIYDIGAIFLSDGSLNIGGI